MNAAGDNSECAHGVVTGTTPVWPPWLRRWLSGTGLAVAVGWGFAEGTLFFIVPDVVPTLTALFCWRAAARQAGGVLLGSLLAGLPAWLASIGVGCWI